jgi:hypothetical protein
MVRTFGFKMDDLEIKVASLSWAQAEAHVEAGRELLQRTTPATADEWLARTLHTVALSLSAASGSEVSTEQLKADYDIPTVNAIYTYILEVSGLRQPQGEATATTEIHSQPSVAA